ncbi:uncharacterized protein LOC121858733 isoform X1 [Homarus americanus]|uniref:uncharacterized protein LOC121858733 isoform X1 n=1 Tax=Homarus americanus TaxID=6706 RepID=UPI001C45C8CE|nr:uncharacterized protein LOC121858733 isoform X1 [Homarus americanus]
MIRPLTTTMAASGTLYTYPENFRAFKVLISAQYSGSKVNVDSNFVFGETNKSEAFLKKFPLGKVPAFETSDGKCIFESNAISWAVANEQLRGKSAMDQAQIVSWMNFADNEILPASCTWVFPCLGIMQFNKGNSERAKEDVKKALGALNTHLLPRTFLVGERISLADISVCCTLLHLYQYVLEPAFRKPFQNVNRWFTTMINQPQVKAIIGDFKLCEKMAQFDNKKFAEVQGKMKQGGGGEKQEKKPKKEQPKKEQPKKEKEPAAEPPAPKPRDPLDALPVGLNESSAQLGDGQPSTDGSGLTPDPTLVPSVVEKVLLEHIENIPNLVFFDLETTGFQGDSDIVQLSAVIGEKKFNNYVLPTKSISWQASEITGLTFKSGSLYHHHVKVDAKNPEVVLHLFLTWLQSVSPLALVAHNCYRFDSSRLLNVIKRYRLERDFEKLVVGFIDTLPLFRKAYPNLENHKQETLVTHILKESYNAHDALADVQALQKLVIKSQSDLQLTLKDYSFTYKSFVALREYEEQGRINSRTLDPLVASNHLSVGMAETIGRSGLSLRDLKLSVASGGRDLLQQILSQPNRLGKPRVTKSRSVVDKIHNFFTSRVVETDKLKCQFANLTI